MSLLDSTLEVKAVTFDLDDTLWPIAPAIARAERRLHDWLRRRFPAVAARYSTRDLMDFRERAVIDHPEVAHDYSALRRLALRHAMAPLGLTEHDVEEAFQVFFAARNEVDLYAEVPSALDRLGRRYRLASISNGNASLAAIGLGDHFELSVSARDAGASKPAPEIFVLALERLGLEPHEVVHVGDDLELDVAGAMAAGMHAVWVNRSGRSADASPVAMIRGLDELPALLAD